MVQKKIQYIIFMKWMSCLIFTQAGRDENIFCESPVDCPEYLLTQLTGMVEFLPACYCDNLCLEYKDCCKQKLNQEEPVRESQKKISNEDPTRLSVCLRIQNDNIGFWVVNRCSNGQMCSNDSIYNVYSNLPVTDGNNQTYVNEECARCNNVTRYKVWSFFFEFNIRQIDTEEFDSRNFIKQVKDGDFSSKQNHFGRMVLTPPLDIFIRVCYRFLSSELSNSTQCPEYQSPVGLMQEIGRFDLYKNLRCCKEAGKCSALRTVPCGRYLRYSNIRIFSQDNFVGVLDPHTSTRLPGVLLQFKNVDHKSSDNKMQCSENRKKVDEKCARSIQLFNLPLGRNKLRLILSESYQDDNVAVLEARYTTLIRSVLGLLFASKWRIKAQDPFPYLQHLVHISESKECFNQIKHCATIDASFGIFSAASLTVEEVEEVMDWTQRIDLLINLFDKSDNVSLTGSFYRGSTDIVDCNCNENKDIIKRGYDTLSNSMLNVKLKDDFVSCSYFVIFVNESSEEAKVTCNERSESKGFRIIGKEMRFLAFLMSTLLSGLNRLR